MCTCVHTRMCVMCAYVPMGGYAPTHRMLYNALYGILRHAIAHMGRKTHKAHSRRLERRLARHASLHPCSPCSAHLPIRTCVLCEHPHANIPIGHHAIRTCVLTHRRTCVLYPGTSHLNHMLPFHLYRKDMIDVPTPLEGIPPVPLIYIPCCDLT